MLTKITKRSEKASSQREKGGEKAQRREDGALRGRERKNSRYLGSCGSTVYSLARALEAPVGTLESRSLRVLETEIFPGTRHVRHITNISPRSQLGGPYASERITQELGHNRTSILDATLERRKPPSSLFPSNIVGENIQRLFHLTLSLSLSLLPSPTSPSLVFFVTP